MLRNKENETKETRYFVERDRNRRKNGKNKSGMEQTDFWEKGEMDTRQEDTHKEKGKKDE